MKTRFDKNWDELAKQIGYGSKRDMLEDMYLTQGLSLSDIGARLGCGTYTVNRHLNMLDINKRGRGGCNGSSYQTRKLFYLDQRIIMTHPLTQLAKLINCSSSLIYKYRRNITRQKEEPWNSVSSVLLPVSNATQP